MKTNPFHQTVIVTGGATGIGYAVAALTQSAVQAMRQQPEGSSGLVFGVARFPLAPVALEMIFESAR